jgi:hypothetical protein
MTISQDVVYAILALDSYNRGYGEGVPDLGGLNSAIGNYTIVDQSDTEEGSVGVAASFYAAAYKDSSGDIVISYRGTDNPLGGDITAWTGGAGFQTRQAELAARSAMQTYPNASITLG